MDLMPGGAQGPAGRRPRLNLHVYPSDFTHESRILRETRSLADAGVFDRIVIGALWRPGLPERERLDARREVWRVRLRSGAFPRGTLRKAMGFLEWTVRVFRALRRERPLCVNCHSLSVLPLGVLFKLWGRSRLVYDTHELETEANRPRFQRAVARVAERLLVGRADAVVVVGESIGAWYRDRYRLDPRRMAVVRNIPPRPTRAAPTDGRALRDACGVPEGAILFLYLGVLGAARGIGILLDAFARLGNDRHLVLMGYGDLEDVIRNRARRQANVHFHPAVKPEEVARYAAGADVGVCLIENACLSYYYCLPNKLFEYLLAGVPVVASDFPDMRRLVDEAGCGWTVRPDVDAVAGLLGGIGREDIARRRAGALASRERYGWDHEERTMLSLYGRLLGPRGGDALAAAAPARAG